MEKRWGISLPLTGIPLPDLGPLLAEAEQVGYRDAWSEEVAETDGFLALASAAQATGLRLGTAITNVFTRGPATLAMSAAGMCELAPGRFCLGIGAASPAIVEGWNGGDFHRPLTRMRDYLGVLRAALAGERVDFEGDGLRVQGFRLGRPPQPAPPIYVAGLRPGMLRLGGAAADGVIVNWMAPADTPKLTAEVRAAATEAGRDPEAVEIVSRIVMVIDPPSEATDTYARRLISGYLTVPAYKAYHQWLGREEELGPMWEAWGAGDRAGAVAAIPEQTVRDLVVTGTPEDRRATVQAFLDAGVDTAVLWFLTAERDPAKAAARIREDIRAIMPARAN